MHGLVALFLGVIALAIILLVIGLVAPCLLVIASTTIVASTILIMMVRLAIVVIPLVTLMVIAVLVTAMMMVAQFMATGGRKKSYFPFLWLILVLGDLLKNASRLVGCLTLLKEGNHSELVGRHHIVQVGKLFLVHFRLRKEDLFTFLLLRGYVHCSMEVVTHKVAKELHSMPHELVHRHESGLLGRKKPENQQVANVGEPGNSLKVVPDALVEVCLCKICIMWASFLQQRWSTQSGLRPESADQRG
jgi:hypothetical protein